jgi:hypothetical protein
LECGVNAERRASKGRRNCCVDEARTFEAFCEALAALKWRLFRNAANRVGKISKSDEVAEGCGADRERKTEDV